MSEGFERESLRGKKISRTMRKQKQVASMGTIQQSLVGHFADIKDPRVERTRETSTHRYLSHCDFSNHSQSARVGRQRELRHQ